MTTTPAEVDALAEQLENNSWRPDSSGDPDCVDQAGAMAAQHLREYAALLRAREAGVTPELVDRATDAAIAALKDYTGDSGRSYQEAMVRAALLTVWPLPSDAQSQVELAAHDAQRAESGAGVEVERERFQLWWGTSKYCQVVSPQVGWEQIAWDGWQARATSAATAADAVAILRDCAGSYCAAGFPEGATKWKDAAEYVELKLSQGLRASNVRYGNWPAAALEKDTAMRAEKGGVS